MQCKHFPNYKRQDFQTTISQRYNNTSTSIHFQFTTLDKICFFLFTTYIIINIDVFIVQPYPIKYLSPRSMKNLHDFKNFLHHRMSFIKKFFGEKLDGGKINYCNFCFFFMCFLCWVYSVL